MDSQALTKTLSKLNELELHSLYKRVFDTEDGALIIQDLKNRFYYDVPTITYGGANDPMAVGLKEGMRTAVIHIETLLKPIEAEVENGERESD